MIFFVRYQYHAISDSGPASRVIRITTSHVVFHDRNAEDLVAATREIGLEVNADKTKYMVMSRDQNAGRIHSED